MSSRTSNLPLMPNLPGAAPLPIKKRLLYAAVLIGTLLGFFLFMFNSKDGGLQYCLAGILFLPAVVLAFGNSTYHVPYILFLWIFNPEIRRVADWIAGEFRPYTILSIVPMLGTLTLLVPVMRYRAYPTKKLRNGLLWIGAAYGYAGIIGMAANGLSALYDLANYFVPLVPLLYAACVEQTEEQRDRWLRIFTTFGVLAAAFACMQYFVYIPDWDKFWMRWAPMGTNGQPTLHKIKAWGTLNSAGPFSVYMIFVLSPMLLRRKWRGLSGWAGIGLVAVALAITLVRSAWIMLVIFLIVYVVSGADQKRFRSLGTIVTAFVALSMFLPFLPGFDKIVERTQSLSNVSKDNSFQVRLATSGMMLKNMVNKPFGAGFGSAGTSIFLTENSRERAAQTTDTGIIVMLDVLGLGGFLMFLNGVRLIYASIRETERTDPALRRYASLARAAFMTFAFSMLFGNVMPGPTGFLLFFFLSLSVQRVKVTKQIPVPFEITPRRLRELPPVRTV
jgi:hypothetical protein